MPLTLPSLPAAEVPKPSNSAPPATALDGSKGTSTEYARADHTHAARVQRAVMTADANGQATIVFARPFEAEPAINALVQGSGADGSTRRVVSVEYTLATTGTGAAQRWTGATLIATTSRPLPAITGLLTNVIATLTGFNPAAPMAGAKISVFAADPTQ